MLKLIKYNNSYLSFLFNKISWKIKDIIVKKFYYEQYTQYLKRKNECIWCKRIHIKKGYFCSNKCKKLYNSEKYQSFKHNNRCNKHKFEIFTYKNQCWSCYIETFKSKPTPPIKSYISLRFNKFKIIPTFRTSKESWNGDKIAFENFLIKKRIKWFIYIKFYEDKNGRIKPIVIGKSGSMLVNYSGSDLNFSTSIKDGPARQFLHLRKLNWHYDNIMIRKCKNEKHAYELETYFMNKFDLFSS